MFRYWWLKREMARWCSTTILLVRVMSIRQYASALLCSKSHKSPYHTRVNYLLKMGGKPSPGTRCQRLAKPLVPKIISGQSDVLRDPKRPVRPAEDTNRSDPGPFHDVRARL